MLFLGSTFCSGKRTLDPSPTTILNGNKITVFNGIIDDLFVTKNINEVIPSPLNKSWDFDTILHTAFDGNLHAGNVGFAVSQVSSLRIKRRIKGAYDWMTIFEVPINSIEDLSFTRLYRYARSQKTYEFSLVAVLNGVEATSNTNEIYSDFDGVVITEKDQSFQTILDTSIHHESNNPTAIATSLDKKYPFVIRNSATKYKSGTVSGLFAESTENGNEFVFDNQWEYQEKLDTFLNNGNPKFLKYQDGRAFLISIVDNITYDDSEHEKKIITTFSWVEIGDVDSIEDMYNNNLSDISPEVGEYI